MRDSKWSGLLRLSVAASVAVVLVGCGGSGDEVSSAPMSSPSAPVSPSPSAPAEATTSPGAVPSPSDSISAPEPVASVGFPEGSRYWTFKDSADSPYSFGAYSKRSGNSMCLIKMYPEYSVETGTVSDTAAGQQFAVNERAETMINPYIPPYVAAVSGDPNVVLTMTWPQGTLVLNASDEAGTAAAIAESNPGADGIEALARITPACG